MKREDLFESIDRQIIAEKVYRKKVKSIITEFSTLQAEKTKKDASWWQENMRTDLFLSPEQLKEFGVIDEII